MISFLLVKFFLKFYFQSQFHFLTKDLLLKYLDKIFFIKLFLFKKWKAYEI